MRAVTAWTQHVAATAVGDDAIICCTESWVNVNEQISLQMLNSR